MGIFGTTAPKFVYDEGGTFQKTVTLTYGIITRNESVTEYVEHRSEIDGDREWVAKCSHREVEIEYNLWKEGTAASRMYNTIERFKGSKVSLYLHSDGDRFETSPGVAALFTLTEVEAWHVETATYKDRLRLTFKSTNPVLIDLTDQDITWNELWGSDYFDFDDHGTTLFSAMS